MPRLMPLPDKHGPAGSARLWFNPDHVVYAIPKITESDTGHVLAVELKLAGVPAMDSWLGSYDSAGAADHGWKAFLADLRGET
jgi:hypothetical protein